jgi:hypothetical protein
MENYFFSTINKLISDGTTWQETIIICFSLAATVLIVLILSKCVIMFFELIKFCFSKSIEIINIQIQKAEKQKTEQNVT